MLRKDDLYECLLHPAYILDKSYFWFQEGFFVKVALIEDVFVKHPDLMKNLKAKSLYDYIITTKADSISYHKIYSFSVSKEKYLKSLDNIVSRNNPNETTESTSTKVAADCGWWCPMGCGSDWVNCGNHSGCCLYGSLECYINDRLCTDCETRWFCFSGCVPD